MSNSNPVIAQVTDGLVAALDEAQRFIDAMDSRIKSRRANDKAHFEVTATQLEALVQALTAVPSTVPLLRPKSTAGARLNVASYTQLMRTAGEAADYLVGTGAKLLQSKDLYAHDTAVLTEALDLLKKLNALTLRAIQHQAEEDLTALSRSGVHALVRAAKLLSVSATVETDEPDVNPVEFGPGATS